MINAGVDGPGAVYAADINSDGHLDVIVASANEYSISWFQNDGSGATWTETVLATEVGDARSVQAVDMDGDDDLDVLAAVDTDQTVMWYKNIDGSGASWMPVTITTDMVSPRSAVAIDMDRDVGPLPIQLHPRPPPPPLFVWFG